MVEFGPSSQINVRVTSLKSILATKLAPRILVPAVTKCYSEVANNRKVRIVSFICIVITNTLFFCGGLTLSGR